MIKNSLIKQKFFKFRIRPSSLSSFEDCQYNWYVMNVLRHPQKTHSRAVLGNSFHKAIEKLWISTKEKERISDKSLLNFCLEYLNKNLKKGMVYSKDENKDILIEYTKKWSGLFFDYMRSIETPNFIEKDVFIKNKDRKSIIKTFGGTVDYLKIDHLKGHTLRDIKVSRSNYITKDKYSLQQSYYVLLVKKVLGIDVKNSFLDVFILNKDSFVKKVSVNIDSNVVRRVIKNIMSKLRDLLEGKKTPEEIFYANKNSFLCDKDFCPLYDICPAVNKKKGVRSWEV